MLSGGLLDHPRKCGASIDLGDGPQSLGGVMVAFSMPHFGYTASHLAERGRSHAGHLAELTASSAKVLSWRGLSLRVPSTYVT